MTRLTPEKFRDALQKGLGRAVMHVREHGAENMRERKLNICWSGCLLRRGESS